jgi:hypothetical protein
MGRQRCTKGCSRRSVALQGQSLRRCFALPLPATATATAPVMFAKPRVS